MYKEPVHYTASAVSSLAGRGPPATRAEAAAAAVAGRGPLVTRGSAAEAAKAAKTAKSRDAPRAVVCGDGGGGE